MFVFLAVFLFFIPAAILAGQSTFVLSDDQVKQRLIQKSIYYYPRNCPCPYHRDKVGKQCGKRSAWSKPGGYSPLCYPSDVTSKMIENYRKEIKSQT